MIKNLQKISSHYLFLAVIFLLGLTLRFYQLGQIPNSLYWDEMAIWVDAQHLLANGTDMHSASWLQAIYPSYGDYKLPGIIWLVSLSFGLFGASEWALRLPNAILGSLQIILMYGLAVNLFANQLKPRPRKILGLLTAVVIAISPWSVLFSRTGFEGFIGQFFLTLSMYFLVTSTKSYFPWETKILPRLKMGFTAFLLSVVVGVIAIYFYFSVRYVWPIIVVVTYLFTQNILGSELSFKKLKSNFSKLLFLISGLGLWFLLTLPILTSSDYRPSQQIRLSTQSILNDQTWVAQAQHYRSLVDQASWSKLIFNQESLQLRRLAINITDHLHPSFLFFRGDANLRHSTTQNGLFLLPFAPFLVVGLIQIWRSHWRQGLLLSIWWVTALIPASVPYATPHALRSLNALAPISIFIAYGGMFLWSQSKLWWRLGQIIWTSWLVWSAVIFLVDYYHFYDLRSKDEWQTGYRQLALEISQQLGDYEEIYVDVADDRFYLWYLGYGKINLNQVQPVHKTNYIVNRVDKVRFGDFKVTEADKYRPNMLYITRADQSLPLTIQFIVYDKYNSPTFIGWSGESQP